MCGEHEEVWPGRGRSPECGEHERVWSGRGSECEEWVWSGMGKPPVSEGAWPGRGRHEKAWTGRERSPAREVHGEVWLGR